MPSVHKLKQDVFFRGRVTPAGRRLLNAAVVLSQPVEWYSRRRAAVRYNERFPSARMRPDEGYAMLPAGTLPGTADVVDACRRIFAAKRPLLDAPVAKGQGKRGGKGSFLKNVLNDEDVNANPSLVDFALSDALFSIVTNYLGIVPTLNRVDLIYSIARPTPGDYISSQLYHQDHEGVRQAKVFLNVFDIGDEHGPFTFIPAGESERVLPAIRRQRSEAGLPHVGHYRDEEIEAHGGLAKEIRSVGPAGTAVVVDTSRCLHSGSRIQPGHIRLCLFLQYCTTRERANVIDPTRFKNDPIRLMALKRFA